MQGKRYPKASSLPFDTCARIAGMVSLRQTRRDDMPDATNPFASRLAGTRITCIGREGVAVVFHLVAIGVCDDG